MAIQYVLAIAICTYVHVAQAGIMFYPTCQWVNRCTYVSTYAAGNHMHTYYCMYVLLYVCTTVCMYDILRPTINCIPLWLKVSTRIFKTLEEPSVFDLYVKKK